MSRENAALRPLVRRPPGPSSPSRDRLKRTSALPCGRFDSDGPHSGRRECYHSVLPGKLVCCDLVLRARSGSASLRNTSGRRWERLRVDYRRRLRDACRTLRCASRAPASRTRGAGCLARARMAFNDGENVGVADHGSSKPSHWQLRSSEKPQTWGTAGGFRSTRRSSATR
jgi:hypothetical protein